MYSPEESNSLAQDYNRYTQGEALLTRSLSLAASSISILAGLVGMYFFLAIDRKKKVFRHQLIIFLIIYDFIKALFLLLYPAKVIAKESLYYDIKFCRVVGFFTAFAIEGSDLAILSFAIHVLLLVYVPQSKLHNGRNYEGGLYRVRYAVYAVSFLLPALLASLAFVDKAGYIPLTNWCYIPSRPLWLRLALSWGPRYFIILSIFIIYGSIYRHVVNKYSKLESTMPESSGKKKERKGILWKVYKFLKIMLFQRVFFSESSSKNSASESSSQSIYAKEASDAREPDYEELNQETLEQFERRKSQVERHMRAIFIYPVSYVFLWAIPLIVHALDFRYGLGSHPIVPLNAISAFMQPFNCTIDTLVFFVREKPWKLTTKKVDSDLNIVGEYPTWRKSISWLPLFSIPEPAEIEKAKSFNVRLPNIPVTVRGEDFSKYLNGSDDFSYIRPQGKEEKPPDEWSIRFGLKQSNALTFPEEVNSEKFLSHRNDASKANLANYDLDADDYDVSEILKEGPSIQS